MKWEYLPVVNCYIFRGLFFANRGHDSKNKPLKIQHLNDHKPCRHSRSKTTFRGKPCIQSFHQCFYYNVTPSSSLAATRLACPCICLAPSPRLACPCICLAPSPRLACPCICGPLIQSCHHHQGFYYDVLILAVPDANVSLLEKPKSFFFVWWIF
jgi:hypothetical protein